MGAIDDVYDDLDADVSAAEFRTAVEEKVEQMGGLADEETAALLIAHELEDDVAETVADVEPGMDEVEFHAKVTRIGERREFERDEGENGRVLNVTVADETGDIRLAFWDARADAVANGEVEVGDVLHVGGRPTEGYAGVEIHVDRVERAADVEIDVQTGAQQIGDLSLGSADVTLRGRVLDVGPIRTFDRDDGSEGRVANAVLGDETGRTRLTGWDERADDLQELDPGDAVEVRDGYVRERDGDLELQVGDRGGIATVDDDIAYEPDVDAIADLDLGDEGDIRGVVRSADPKRTFDRDDGSEGQVRNVRVQDDTDDIRVALWGDKADRDIAPGDELVLTDVEIQDGWQDDREASAGWASTLTVLDGDGTGEIAAESGEAAADGGGDTGGDGGTTGSGLDAFADDRDDDAEGPAGGEPADAATAGGGGGATDGGGPTPEPEEAADGQAELVELTGAVVQPGDPAIVDTGDDTVAVDTDADLELGAEVTVRGRRTADGIDATDVVRAARSGPSE
jgi:replication factor A1